MIRTDLINENLSVRQRTDGLLFGTDSLLLSAFLRPSGRAYAADFGSGCGVLSLLSAKKGFFRHLFAVELQEEYCELIRENLSLNSLFDSVTLLQKDVRSLSPRDFGRELDVVFTNPPYMKKGSGKTSPYPIRHFSRSEENGDIFDFCAAASRCLRSGGLFYAVYRPERTVDLFDALRSHRLEPKRAVFVCPKSGEAPNLILVEAKKDASPSLFLPKPFLLKNESGEDSEEMKYLLMKGVFPDEYTVRSRKESR